LTLGGSIETYVNLPGPHIIEPGTSKEIRAYCERELPFLARHYEGPVPKPNGWLRLFLIQFDGSLRELEITFQGEAFEATGRDLRNVP
jgi:hypothetical protein